MHSNRFKTIVTVVLFTILFITVGWVTPALYAAYAPQDTYIEGHSFDAPDASVGQDEHTICFNRSIHKQAVGEVFTELYLVNDDGDRVKVGSKRTERVFQEGQTTVRITVTFPEIVERGDYRYERVYNMELANGRINRQFSFTSNKFTISDTNDTEAPPC